MFDGEGDQSRAALSRVLLAVEGVTGADPERSQALLAEAEQQFRADDDDWGLGVIGFVRMETALKTGHLETAIAVGRAAAAQFRQLDDYWGLSAILYHLGWGLRQFGRNEEGAHELEEAIDVAASAGLYNTVQWALADLALAHLNLGRRDAATRSLRPCRRGIGAHRRRRRHRPGPLRPWAARPAGRRPGRGRTTPHARQRRILGVEDTRLGGMGPRDAGPVPRAPRWTTGRSCRIRSGTPTWEAGR